MEINQLKKILDLATKGLSAMTTELRVELKDVPKEADRLIVYNLCLTMDDACTDPVLLQKQIQKTFALKEKMKEQVSAIRILPDDAIWAPEDASEYASKLQEVEEKETANADANSLRTLILKGVKGVALFVYQAYLIGYEDEGIDPFLQRVLQRTLKYNLSVGLLFNLALEVGGYTYRAMGLLDKASKAEYGEAELTNVELGVRKNPGILVTGSNLYVLRELLEATKDTGVDVYTHDDMLSAHYYGLLKKYDHFAGNYGGSMKDQEADFTSFNGPILVTGTGLHTPLELYKDRIYTTAHIVMPGYPYIELPFDGTPDFSAIIEQAKTLASPVELRKGEFIGGFGHETLEKMDKTVLASLKDETIKKMVVVVGSDGTEQERTYYTELVNALPKTSAVLTAGSIKYRLMNQNLGTLRGVPRLMDVGGAGDLYSVAVTALRFQSELEKYDINGIPFAYTVSLSDEVSICTLLALIYVGIKGIYIGPALPDFLTENVFTIFQKNFSLRTIGTVEEDVQELFKEKEKAAEGTVDTQMLIIDIMERWPEATEILMSCGMSCVTCGSALYESLEEACMVHGLDPEDVKEVLDHELGLVDDD